MTQLLPPTVIGDDIAAIVRRRSDMFEQDFASGDAARLVANYYVAMPKIIAPDAPMMDGRPAAVAMFESLFTTFAACSLRQHEVRQSGDMAFELGDAILTPHDPATSPMESRYLIIWHKSDGEWAVAIDFFAAGLLALDASGNS